MTQSFSIDTMKSANNQCAKYFTVALIYHPDITLCLFNEYQNDPNCKQCGPRLDFSRAMKANGISNLQTIVIRVNFIFNKTIPRVFI